MKLAPDFGVATTAEEFEQRLTQFHKQLFASTEYSFDDVCRHVFAPQPGMAQFDHSFIHDDEGRLHLFYGTGDQKLQPEWHERVRAKDWEGANRVCCERGNGHAVGTSLFDLEFREHVFFQPQGRLDILSRSVCSMFRHEGRYGMFYDVRGADENNNVFIGISLAWSDDLHHWELDPSNPVFTAPSWACKGSSCKDPHILFWDGEYLIYYICMDENGYCCVALASTTDWKIFCDEGCVLRVPPSLRGTMGTESPAVVCRDGMWHLFFTYGPGLWHSIGRGPRSFIAPRSSPLGMGSGTYYMGAFHATETIEHNGRWWLTTDRKEETRRLNRASGRLCFRGTYEDEKTLEEGIYVAEIVWKGDQPTLVKPTEYPS